MVLLTGPLVRRCSDQAIGVQVAACQLMAGCQECHAANESPPAAIELRRLLSYSASAIVGGAVPWQPFYWDALRRLPIRLGHFRLHCVAHFAYDGFIIEGTVSSPCR